MQKGDPRADATDARAAELYSEEVEVASQVELSTFSALSVDVPSQEEGPLRESFLAPPLPRTPWRPARGFWDMPREGIAAMSVC